MIVAILVVLILSGIGFALWLDEDNKGKPPWPVPTIDDAALRSLRTDHMAIANTQRINTVTTKPSAVIPVVPERPRVDPELAHRHRTIQHTPQGLTMAEPQEQKQVTTLPVPAVERRSVTVDMAHRFGMEPGAFEQTLRATVIPGGATKEQFAAFLMVAREYELNPIVKEIFAFPAKGGGIIPVVSVDGWMRIINSHPQMNGLKFEDHRDDEGHLTSITARIYRKDREHETEVTEYMAECKRDTDTWKKWPARMLRHKAAIQAARYAFGFAGIYDLDEAERMKNTAGAGIAPGALEDIEAQPGDDTSGQFLGGEITDLLLAEYTRLFAEAKDKGALDAAFASFKRKYFNKSKRRVSQNFYDGIEELHAQAEARLDEEAFQAHQREVDVTAAAAADGKHG